MHHNITNQTNKKRECNAMKRISLAQLAFIVLLIGQIIFYAITFPRLLSFTGGNLNACLVLLFVDILGIASWCAAWELDHRPTPRTWLNDARIVLLLFGALLMFHMQFYAW